MAGLTALAANTVPASDQQTAPAIADLVYHNGVMAMQKEDETGTIEPGKSADFIVIDQNILESPVENIHKTKVLKTVLQGHTVYEAK